MHIRYGYNRDHGPDLKQFNCGLVVSGDGIPIIGEAMDGNTQDKVWNRRVLEELVERLSGSLGDLVYVADSAVVMGDSLDIAALKGIKFISRLPAVFNQEKEVKDRAWAEGGWAEVNGIRALAESPLFPDKMFKALGVSPSVYLCALQQNAGP